MSRGSLPAGFTLDAPPEGFVVDAPAGLPPGFALDAPPEGFVIDRPASEAQPRAFGSIRRGFNVAEQGANVYGYLTGALTPEEAAAYIAANQADIEASPPSEAVRQGMEEIQAATGPWEAAKAIARNPSAVVSAVGESLAPSALSIITGAAGGLAGSLAGPVGTVAGLAAGAGAGSFATEFGATVLDTLRDRGVNMADQTAIAAALQNPEIMTEAQRRGIARGIPIAAFDALSAGVAGRIFGPVARTTERLGAGTAGSRVAGGVAELGVQGTTGAAGEAAAQLSDKGRIESYGDIGLEFAGEAVTGVGESTVGALLHRRSQAGQAPPQVAGAVQADEVSQPASPTETVARETVPLAPPPEGAPVVGREFGLAFEYEDPETGQRTPGADRATVTGYDPETQTVLYRVEGGREDQAIPLDEFEQIVREAPAPPAEPEMTARQAALATETDVERMAAEAPPIEDEINDWMAAGEAGPAAPPGPGSQTGLPLVGPGQVVPRAVYVERAAQRTGASIPVAEQAHKLQVMQALSNGVRLPDEVLADYRDDADVQRVLADRPATQDERAAFAGAQGPLGQAAEEGRVRGGVNPAFDATDTTPGPLGQAVREGRVNQGPANPAFERTTTPDLEAKYNALVSLVQNAAQRRIALTDEKRLAKALSVPRRLVTPLLQRAYQSGVINRTADGRFFRKPAPGTRVARNENILQWISRVGGIRDDLGDLRALGLETWHREQPRGTRRLINPNGLTADDLTQRAIEEGFLAPVDADSDQQYVDASRLFALIEQQAQFDATGAGMPVLRPEETADFLDQLAAARGNDEALNALEQRAADLDVPGRRPLESLDAFAARLDEAAAEREALQDEGSFAEEPGGEDVPFDTRFSRDPAFNAPQAGPSISLAADLTGTPSAAPADVRDAVADAVYDVLSRVVGPEAQSIVMGGLYDRDGNPVLGAFSPSSPIGRLVSIAMHGPDPLGTTRHEAVHWLRDAGLLDDKSWTVLSRAAERGGWADRFGIDLRYEGLTAEQRVEEVVADAYQAWNNGAFKPTGAVETVFQAIRSVLERVGNAIRGLGFRTADDVFRAIEGGDYASRGASVVDRDGEVIDTYASPEEARAAASRIAETVETSVERIRRADAMYDGLAADAKGGVAAASRYQREAAPPALASIPGGERLWSLGRIGRVVGFPRAIAKLDRQFARYWRARQSEQALAEQRLQTYSQMIPTYAKLSAAEKDAVHKIEEHDRLNKVTRDRDYGGRLVVRLPDGPVSLTREATKAFFERRRLFAKMWRDQAREYGRLMGYEGPLTEAGFAAHLERADAPGVRLADREYAQETVAFLRRFLERERAGYVPFMRYGEQFIAVRPKQAEEGFPQTVYREHIEAPPWRNLVGGSAKTVSQEVQTRIAELRKQYPEADFDITTGEVKASEESLLDPDTLAEFLSRFAERRDQLLVQKVPTKEQIARARENIAARYGWEGPLKDKELATLEKIQRDTGFPEEADRIAALRAELAGFDEAAERGDALPLGTYLNDEFKKGIHEHLERKFLREARDVPGYSRDFERATADYMRSVAGSIARSRTREDRDAALLDLRRRTSDGMAKYVEWFDGRMDDPSVSDFAALRQVGFYTFLAASPGGALVNLSQTPVVTANVLGKIAGVGQAQKATYAALMRALRGSTFRNGVFTIDVERIGATPAERAYLRSLLEDGTLQAQMTQDLQGMQDLVGSRLREVVGARQAYGRLKKVGDFLASTFGWSEQVNRAAAALAAYRLAQSEAVRTKAAGVHAADELFQEMVRTQGLTPETIGRFMVDDTQFVGGKLNRPMLMTGAGALVFQFKQFPFQVLGLMLRQMRAEGREGKIAVGMMLATMFLLAGAYGPPFAEDLKDGLEWFLRQATGVDRDLDREFRSMVREFTGATEDGGWSSILAETILRGPSRYLTGTDLGGRLGMGNIVPDPTLSSALGVPFAGLIGLPWQAYQYAKTERPISAAATLIPVKGLRDAALAGFALPEEGLTTQRGGLVIPPEEIGAGERVARGLGVQPADFARTREERFSAQRVQNATKEATSQVAETVARLRALAIRAEEAQDASRAGRLHAQADRVLEEAVKRFEAVMAEAEKARAEGRDARAARLTAQAIPPPTRSAIELRVKANLDPEASAVQRGAKLKREELSNSPFPGR